MPYATVANGNEGILGTNRGHRALSKATDKQSKSNGRDAKGRFLPGQR